MRNNNESFLNGQSALYLEQLYEQYLEDPGSLSLSWKAYFDELSKEAEDLTKICDPMQSGDSGLAKSVTLSDLERRSLQAKVSQLISAYRYLGHLQADTNPLGSYAYKVMVPELMLEYHELEDADLKAVFDPGSFNIEQQPTLENLIQAMRKTYLSSIGFEYMHMMDVQEKRWIQSRIEPNQATDILGVTDQKQLLEQLTEAEGFEQFLHKRYVGQKRFGLEGGESLIPMLQTLIQEGAAKGLREIVLGMAHRGRLNVLINVLCKSPAELFNEFAGKNHNNSYTGDVKYHQGYSADVSTPSGDVHLALAFNPSHLEIVSPVVEGSVRARQERREDADGTQVMGIVIHGDAAFAGQGVVMETFSMAQTRGYRTHGTIHIVVNNQIGFTTSTVMDSRSTYYPTDVAKMINAPIIHVNGDDPEAVIYAAKVALDYREVFHKDVVLDLVCYRRLGHNEADEPAMTQPVMYDIIRNLPTTRDRYAAKLMSEGVISADENKAMIAAYREHLSEGQVVGRFHREELADAGLPAQVRDMWAVYKSAHWTDYVDTRFPRDKIQSLASHWLAQIPETFDVHRRVRKIYETRSAMGHGEVAADWGFGETMAYASLLQDGINIRLAGQDCGRGTFSHRHAVIHHQKHRQQWIPLAHTGEGQGTFTVIDSLLSEEAVLAFEYGYSTAVPNNLVIWEAQFGDFANGAQVVIDQFISSGEQKWQRLCGLVMFLPHGFEGQGPEHSSARLERFVQLAAQHNIQICIPTTPSQVFHMIRRQRLRQYRKPLIVFTPKSLLRHPLAVSDLTEFTDGGFMPVIDDPDLDEAHKPKVTRLIVSSGKVFYDLLAKRREHELRGVALLRLEQLYPFPKDVLHTLLEPYSGLESLIWCQEEPVNQGAWDGIRHRFEVLEKLKVFCVSRPASAAPAVGSLGVHKQQQEDLVNRALGLEVASDN